MTSTVRTQDFELTGNSTVAGTSTVVGLTTLGQTTISTNNGQLSVTGSNSANISVSASALFSGTTATLQSSTGDVTLTSATSQIKCGSAVIQEVGTPVVSTDAANKGYVDGVVVSASSNMLENVVAAQTFNLSGTYANGTAGVGATLTGGVALPTVDGLTITAGQRIALVAQTSALENGVYVATTVTNPFVLTRATDMNSSTKFPESTFTCTGAGALTGGTAWMCMNPATPAVVVGTDSITIDCLGTITVNGGIRRRNSLQTTGNAYTAIFSFTPKASSIYNIEARIVGRLAGYATCSSFFLRHSVYCTSGGTTTSMGGENLLAFRVGGGTTDASFSIASNVYSITIRGITATTIDWQATIDIVSMLT